MTNTSFAPEKGMSAADIDATVDTILNNASVAEKVAMMSGKGFFEAYVADGKVWAARPYRAGGGCERLDVPALWFTDGPRGVARGNSTAFPCTMARGASFDTDLEHRIGQAMSIEARAQGCNLSGAVCVNLLRHPGWGRAQETYGEDPCHLGQMGAALATGIQHHNVIATVKHFAGNSIENSRFKVDVRMDERTLHDVYLPHFKTIIDAGCASVMSAYNRINGPYAAHNHDLLTKILRDDWGFSGFVHSDWIMGVYGPDAAAAGCDVENPEPLHYGAKLIAAVESGVIAPAVLDTACRRILTTLYRFAAAPDPIPDYHIGLVASEAHRALAREAAVKSAVLLKNDALLPLSRDTKIAVFGALADVENTGDNGSSKVCAPDVITPWAGISARFTGAVQATDPAAAAAADSAIVVAGLTALEEGEFIPGGFTLGADTTTSSIGGDRRSLRLPDDQVALIRAVAAANPRTLVAIVAGSAILTSEWIDDVAGVMQTFYAGMEGGHALADLLDGSVSPSARLPFTVMQDEADYPFFDPDAETMDYGYYHGYSLADRDGLAVQFPFGFGLSYTRFDYANLSTHRDGDAIVAEIDVTNRGDVTGDDVVLLFVSAPGVDCDRPKRLLKGFARVTLTPGETWRVMMRIVLNDLRWWNPAMRGWATEAGDYRISVSDQSATITL
jgi:beta-glucosidase